MHLSIQKGSENYTAQVISLPAKVEVPSLDNLVRVTYQGNDCLVQKTSDSAGKYLFFPSGCVLDQKFLFNNNLFRHAPQNLDPSKTGFFEDSGRVKALKFKGIISTGFIIPAASLGYLIDPALLPIGESFTDINGQSICRKFIRPQRGFSSGGVKIKNFDIQTLVDPKFAPEHTDTAQLLKNCQHLGLLSQVTITHKLHGTSIRVFHTLTKRRLNLMEKLLKKLGVNIQDREYSYLVGSRRLIKSKNFGSVNNYRFFKPDLWTKVAQDSLKDKLNKGESIYAEIVGSDFEGGAIQQGYTYGLPGPKLFIYRITQINPEGIEVDLSWSQVKQRASQLGLDTVPEFYHGMLAPLLQRHYIEIPDLVDEISLQPALEELFYKHLLDMPSILDPQVTEEGFVLRQDSYPCVRAYKIKSRKFQLYESGAQDKQLADMEEDN